MSRILAFQHNRRKFFLQRRYSCLPKVLPQKAVQKFAALGSLDPHTGKLKINEDLINIFKEYEVWTDFDKEISSNSYKSILKKNQ